MTKKRSDPISTWLRTRRKERNKDRMKVTFQADGLGVSKKNTSFLDEPAFSSAWSKASDLNREGWSKTGIGVPDIRWRAHTCCWAAKNAMHLDGDFVECGVHTGLLSLTAAFYVDLNSTEKAFWLFDTYDGIPVKNLSGMELSLAKKYNDGIYFDVYELAKRNFASFENAKIVKGLIPDSLLNCEIEKISYLSIDLNNAPAEKSAIEHLWPKLVAGAIIVLDDYACRGYEAQYEMWNRFALDVGHTIMSLPTGQGLLIRQK